MYLFDSLAKRIWDGGKLVKHFCTVYQITLETPPSSQPPIRNVSFRNRETVEGV